MSYWHNNPFDDEEINEQSARFALGTIQLLVFVLAFCILAEVM